MAFQSCANLLYPTANCFRPEMVGCRAAGTQYSASASMTDRACALQNFKFDVHGALVHKLLMPLCDHREPLDFTWNASNTQSIILVLKSFM